MRNLALVPSLIAAMALAGCGHFFDRAKKPPEHRPETTGAGMAPPAGARTADEFDTTTDAERQEAVAPTKVAGEKKLGLTIASLGDPAAPGFWLETPLVTETTQGRVVNPATGASVRVELRPSGGAAGSGSRVSLAAMRLLGAALTDLPELEVYAG